MYKGIITKLSEINPHPNADKLNIAMVSGFQIIISKDHQVGELGVFFPIDGALSSEMCITNRLYRKHPTTGEALGGYFEATGRVKSVKLRGQRSEGVWLPINTLAWTGAKLESLKEGETIDVLNGKKICEKYLTKAERQYNSKRARTGQPKVKFPYFFRHFDTEQLKYHLTRLPKGAVVFITEKLHGTSARTGLTLVQQKRSIWDKLFGRKKDHYEVISGTRNCILFGKSDSFYDGDKFRAIITDKMKAMPLMKRETIFYEIVGYTDTKKTIMATYKVDDPEAKKKYGDRMVFSYGTDVDAKEPFDVYVYRITNTTEEGTEIDLSFTDMVRRCNQLGLKHVPLLDVYIHDGDPKNLLAIAKKYASDEPSTLCTTHVREGVVLWIEDPVFPFKALKLKSNLFCDLEEIAKTDDEFVDKEEVS